MGIVIQTSLIYHLDQCTKEVQSKPVIWKEVVILASKGIITNNMENQLLKSHPLIVKWGWNLISGTREKKLSPQIWDLNIIKGNNLLLLNPKGISIKNNNLPLSNLSKISIIRDQHFHHLSQILEVQVKTIPLKSHNKKLALKKKIRKNK